MTDLRPQALKLVSLSISNESPRRPLRDNPELRVQDTALWLPDIPPTCLTIHGASDRWAIRPILMITLGDNQGSRLKHLVKITVWIEVRDAIRGIDFFFSDSQEPLRFGVFERRPSPSRGKDLPDERLEKVDFAVNGPDGERIIAIDTCYSRASGCCQGFRVGQTDSAPQNHSKWTCMQSVDHLADNHESRPDSRVPV